MKNSPEDKQIISKILRGNSEAETGFKELVDKYGRLMYSNIYRMIGNESQTKDVLQNSFIKIWENLYSYRQDSTLYTWIYRICRNESLNFLEKEKIRTVQSLDDSHITILPGHSALDNVDGTQILSLLNQAIEQLPEKQAIVFRLKYFDDLQYSEIAALTGTSEGALKASFHIASRKIEEYLLSKLNQ